MVWFTVETTYTQDRDALMAARPGHREYLTGLLEQGRIAAAGPWADDSAGFAVYRVDDRAELDRLLADDPYTTGGVVADRTVNEWRIVLGSVGPQ